MIDNELLDALRYKSESTDLDFKREQYRFANGSDFEKSELLKDILAMANAWRDGTGYILLGFRENRPHLAEVTGIEEQIDDSRLQQFVNGKVKPKLIFSYEEHLYEGKLIGVIAIPKQKRPFFLTKNYGKLKSNVAYVRRGSSTAEAEPTEIAAMGSEDSRRRNVLLDLRLLTSENEPLPESVELKYLTLLQPLPDYKSPREKRSPFEYTSEHLSWRDNSDFWREYARYMCVNAALIEIKFTLENQSETTLSNAKMEVSVIPSDGQICQILSGADLPDEPSPQYNVLAGIQTLPEMLNRREASLVVDGSGSHPICRVQFGSLLPGEEGRPPDILALVPSGPGTLKLRCRIFAAELTTPLVLEHLLETTGDSVTLDVEGFMKIFRQKMEARHASRLADERDSPPALRLSRPTAD